jgi:glycerate 2-kinase
VHLAQILTEATGTDVSHIAGAGAAGGLPACLLAFLNAELLAGIYLVANVVGLTAVLAEADLVLTGEGSFDSQSLLGKVVHGVLLVVHNNFRIGGGAGGCSPAQGA